MTIPPSRRPVAARRLDQLGAGAEPARLGRSASMTSASSGTASSPGARHRCRTPLAAILPALGGRHLTLQLAGARPVERE